MNLRAKKPNPSSYCSLVGRYHVSEKYILSIFRVEASEIVRIVASWPAEMGQKRRVNEGGQSPRYGEITVIIIVVVTSAHWDIDSDAPIVKSGRPITYNLASRKECLEKAHYFFVFLPTLSLSRL
jgi:hypothetical protein